MGDVHVCSARTSGALGCEAPSTFTENSSNPHPSSIDAEKWRLVEQATEAILLRIHPTGTADRRRKEVVEYVRSLIKGVSYAEIFPFGSVPLKTYLPDGDIDLTAIEAPRSEDTLAKDVLAVLQAEERNRNSEFEVKDVQYIHAEVKLVKCLVQNIVVDISFQQIGGLCTLCFLEKVDQIIGKNHLFKRSVILIKSWCYYESRILGAHHGLISTYALETLVLYIFHVFHSSLDGPLAVLYRFLDYFSKFDWDKYCVSLNGPVCLSSLPDIVAEAPETDGGGLLLSRDFLRSCEDTFASAFKWSDNNSSFKSFHQKHLNIIDPLKANNNLGRSVSQGNFYRIRSAFTYGARKLGIILVLPREGIIAELNKFFMNTLDRHDIGDGSDVPDNGSLDSRPSASVSISLLSKSAVEKDTGSRGRLSEGKNSIRDSVLVAESSIQEELHKRLTENHQLCSTLAESNGSNEGIAASGLYQTDYIKTQSDLAEPKNKRNARRSLHMGSANNNSSSHSINHAPHLFFPKEDINTPNSELEAKKMNRCHPSSRKASPATSECTVEADVREKEMAIVDCSLEFSGLSDLTGDYDTHMENLWYAVGCLEKQSSPIFYNQHQQIVFPKINANGMVHGPFSPSNYYTTYIPGTYGLEDMPKTRGTGTYFPNVSHWTYMERRSPGKGRNQAPPSLLTKPRNNSRPSAQADKTGGEKGSNGSCLKVPQVQVPAVRFPQFLFPHPNGNVQWRPGQPEACLASCATSGGSFPASGSPLPPEEAVFGTFVAAKMIGAPSEPSRNLEPPAPLNLKHISEATETSSTAQKPMASSAEGRPKRLYQLKDEDDFPPLRG